MGDEMGAGMTSCVPSWEGIASPTQATPPSPPVADMGVRMKEWGGCVCVGRLRGGASSFLRAQEASSKATRRVVVRDEAYVSQALPASHTSSRSRLRACTSASNRSTLSLPSSLAASSLCCPCFSLLSNLTSNSRSLSLLSRSLSRSLSLRSFSAFSLSARSSVLLMVASFSLASKALTWPWRLWMEARISSRSPPPASSPPPPWIPTSPPPLWTLPLRPLPVWGGGRNLPGGGGGVFSGAWVGGGPSLPPCPWHPPSPSSS